MEDLNAKKVRLLSRWLLTNSNEPTPSEAMRSATSILTLLDEIEQAHWARLEEMNAETHCTENYDKS